MVINRGKTNFIMQITSEFVFIEKDTDTRRGGSSSNATHPKRGVGNLNKIEEFQMILALIDYFSQPGPDSTRNAVFISLFGNNLNPQRTKILCKLVSTSISGAVAPILSSVGTWMQQTGCTSPACLEVAQTIVSDFVIFSHKTSEQLKQLPLVAPHFAANLMCSVTELYLNDQWKTLTLPPDGLIDVFCEWLNDNSNLCMASQQTLALPPGAIPMTAKSPLLGLIRWSILAPFVTNALKYSDFHLSILRTILEISISGTVKTIINANDLQHLIAPLHNLHSQFNNKMSTKDKTTNTGDMEMCLERFAQIIQLSISSQCIYGNMSQLLSALDTLPSHQLLKIIIQQNRMIPTKSSESNSIKQS